MKPTKPLSPKSTNGISIGLEPQKSGTVDETERRLYRLLQPGALQFEIEKAESRRIQNPACTEHLNRAFIGYPRFGRQSSFQTTFFPSRILQKQKHRRPIHLRCFLIGWRARPPALTHRSGLLASAPDPLFRITMRGDPP